MSMISTPARRVKPTRSTARPAVPFGASLVRFVPPVVHAAGFVEPSDEDKAAVAVMFADEPDYDVLAGESAFLDSCAAITPRPADSCRSCGHPAEIDRDGLCNACERAGTEATIAGENGRAGLGDRTF